MLFLPSERSLLCLKTNALLGPSYLLKLLLSVNQTGTEKRRNFLWKLHPSKKTNLKLLHLQGEKKRLKTKINEKCLS